MQFSSCRPRARPSWGYCCWACHSFSEKWRRKQEEEDHPFFLFLFLQSSRLGSTHASANKVLDSPIVHSITCIPTIDFLQLKPLTFVFEGCWQTWGRKSTTENGGRGAQGRSRRLSWAQIVLLQFLFLIHCFLHGLRRGRRQEVGSWERLFLGPSPNLLLFFGHSWVHRFRGHGRKKKIGRKEIRLG